MGRRPKCLLQRDGQPLIQHLVHALRTAGVAHVVVVLGHYAAQISLALQGLAVHVVHNPEPDQGQASSLHLGLRALPEHLGGVVVALADQPLISAADVADLLQAFAQRPAGTDMLVPTVVGLPGNPVVFSERVRQDLLASGPDVGGKQWQRAHPEQLYRWPTANDHYRQDVDAPDDLAALAAHKNVHLSWATDNP
jgi:molybdenum cofactor cytidylyltransferase